MNKLTLEVDLKIVKSNIEYLSQNKKVALVVCGNAFGMGYEIINHYIEMGVDFFCVNTIQEALKVRKINSKVDVLIMSFIDIFDYQKAIEYNLIVSIYDINQFNHIPSNLKIHLKFDLLNSINGLTQNNIEILKHSINNFNIQGIYSNLNYELDCEKQINEFKDIIEELNFDFKYIHLQNSIGCIEYKIGFCNMVRPGIGALGVLYKSQLYEKYVDKLKNAIILTAPVISNKFYEGDIGYGSSVYVNGYVKTINIGYCDGFLSDFKNFKFKNGSQIIGSIGMNHTLILNDNEIKIQEIFGNFESIYNLCDFCDKICYEILINLNEGIQRIYRKGKYE